MAYLSFQFHGKKAVLSVSKQTMRRDHSSKIWKSTSTRICGLPVWEYANDKLLDEELYSMSAYAFWRLEEQYAH